MSKQCWLDDYSPSRLEELAIFPTKVKAVQKWITDATDAHQRFEHKPNIGFRPYVLVLCGCSGGGKSTMVSLLCRALSVQCIEWSDDMIELDTAGNLFLGGPYSSNSYFSNYSTLASELLDYAHQSSYPRLPLSSGRDSPDATPSIGSHGRLTNYIKKILLMHSPPFQNIRKSDMRKYSECLLSFKYPVIIILSDVGGSDDMGFAANQALGLDPLQISRLNYSAVYCNPVTELRTVKAMERIVNCVLKEYNRVMSVHKQPRARTARCPPYRPSDDELADIAASSSGDVRHAVIQLQLLCTYKANKRKDTNSAVNKPPLRRDVGVSSLRGVGRLLGAQQSYSGRFEEDLELLLERSEFPIDMSMAFMQFHCVESLMRTSKRLPPSTEHNAATTLDGIRRDIALLEDIGFALECFSEASLFWDRQYASSTDILEAGVARGDCAPAGSLGYPVSYAVSIASRAVAVARGHPSRSWTEPSFSQGWISPGSSQEAVVLDITEERFVDKRNLKNQNKRKKIKILNDVEHRSSGGFLKLTRPKVLDLWRRKKWSNEMALDLRAELIMPTRCPLEEDCIVRSRLPMKELFCTVIPLLREMIRVDCHNRACGHSASYFSSVPYGVLESEINPVSSAVRRILSKIFALNNLSMGSDGNPVPVEGEQDIEVDFGNSECGTFISGVDSSAIFPGECNSRTVQEEVALPDSDYWFLEDDIVEDF